MKKHYLDLKVVPLDDGTYRLELWEPPAPDTKPPKRRRSEPLSSLEGWHLQLAEGLVKRALESNGYRPSELKRMREKPFNLREEDGVKLDLAFRATGNLKLRTRIEDILHGIKGMSREEALYWHAKVRGNNGGTREEGVKALRLLLGGDTR